MSRFVDLTGYAPELSPGHFDFAARDRLFPSVVADSPFRLWKPGDPIPQRGVRILLGVATWSRYDTHLLDVVEQALRQMGSDTPKVEVFNAGTLTSQAAFSEYIPGLAEVMQMPVAGIWRDGRLVEHGSGHHGRDLVARMFGSSSDEIFGFVQNLNPMTRST